MYTAQNDKRIKLENLHRSHQPSNGIDHVSSTCNDVTDLTSGRMRTPPNSSFIPGHQQNQQHANIPGTTLPANATPANCYSYRTPGYGSSSNLSNAPYIPSPYVTPPSGTGTGTDFYTPYTPAPHATTTFLNFGAGVTPPSCQLTPNGSTSTPSSATSYHHHPYHHHHHQGGTGVSGGVPGGHLNAHATFVQNSPPYTSHITNIMNFGTAPPFPTANPLV